MFTVRYSLFFIPAVGSYDLAHQLMPNDIAFVQVDEVDAGSLFKDPVGMDQT